MPPCNCSLDLEAPIVLSDSSHFLFIVVGAAIVMALLFILCEILSKANKMKVKEFSPSNHIPKTLEPKIAVLSNKVEKENEQEILAAGQSKRSEFPPPYIPFTRTIPSYPLSPGLQSQARMPWRLGSSSLTVGSLPNGKAGTAQGLSESSSRQVSKLSTLHLEKLAAPSSPLAVVGTNRKVGGSALQVKSKTVDTTWSAPARPAVAAIHKAGSANVAHHQTTVTSERQKTSSEMNTITNTEAELVKTLVETIVTPSKPKRTFVKQEAVENVVANNLEKHDSTDRLNTLTSSSSTKKILMADIEELKRVAAVNIQTEEPSESSMLAHSIMVRLLRGQQESDILFQQIKSLESKMEQMTLELGKRNEAKVTQGVQTIGSSDFSAQGQRSIDYVAYEVSQGYRPVGSQVTTQIISLEAVPKWSPPLHNEVHQSPTSTPQLVPAFRSTDESKTMRFHTESLDSSVQRSSGHIRGLSQTKPRDTLEDGLKAEVLQLEFNRKLTETMETIRKETRLRFAEEQDEQRCMFLKRETSLQQEIGRMASSIENQAGVLSGLQWNLNKFEKNIKALVTQKELLENCTREVKSGWDADKRTFQEDRHRLEELLQKISSERQELLAKFESLKDVKVALDTELKNYRVLVEQEEQRQPLSLMSQLDTTVLRSPPMKRQLQTETQVEHRTAQIYEPIETHFQSTQDVFKTYTPKSLVPQTTLVSTPAMPEVVGGLLSERVEERRQDYAYQIQQRHPSGNTLLKDDIYRTAAHSIFTSEASLKVGHAQATTQSEVGFQGLNV